MNPLSFKECEELFPIIDAPLYRKNRREKQLTDVYYFYLKCWDNRAPNLGKGRDAISLLARKFPNDSDCRSFFPMGNFKALEGLSHETIYDKWIQRFTTRIEDYNGKDSTIMKFVGLYMIKKYRELHNIILSREVVLEAICLNLYQGARGMALEDIINKMKIKEFENDPRLIYKAAPSELEYQDIDGLLCWRESEEIIRRYSIKTNRAFTDENILKKRYGMEDGKEKLEPTHYIGFETMKSNKIIEKPASRFPRPENLDELRLKWQRG